MNKRYLVSEANLFYNDETFFSSTDGGGHEPIIVFKTLEEAKAKKKRLQAAKVRDLIHTDKLKRYITFGNNPIEASDEIFNIKLKKQLNNADFDLNNDTHIITYIDTLKQVYDLDCADFFYIYDIDLE